MQATRIRPGPEAGVRVLDSLGGVREEVEWLCNLGRDVGFDIETTDTDPITSKMVALQFKAKGKRAAIIDVRHFGKYALLQLGKTLAPLFDGPVTLVGQNLKFDLEFLFAQMGLAAHKIYDTMLAEQVILGLGMSSASEKGIHLDLASIGARYGVEVEKESRAWFPHLDERPEEWNAPFPETQIRYMRQDVSVVHKIKEAQQTRIDELDLRDVADLEMRAAFALVGMEVWGVQINVDGWLSVIDRVEEKAKELERTIHLGTDDFEGLDVHVLKVRSDRRREKWEPYEKWMKERDAFMATRKAEWETVPKGNQLVTPEGAFRNWSEYKKFSLAWWYEHHEKLVKPPENKEGVNLGSWMQVRDGFNHLFAQPEFWQPSPLDKKIREPIVLESVSDDVLAEYRGVHPLVGVYLDYAQHRKIVTVYGREKGKKKRAFIDLLDEHGRLRAGYHQVGTDTQRMSGHDPNFQQMPDKGIGAELRKNVIAAPGFTLIDADFSNIELRIVAELSGDKFLLDAFASGQDVHAYTAQVMFNLDIPPGENIKKWTEEHNAVVGGRELPNTSYRKSAKTINYALLYGAGVKRLMALLGVGEGDAKGLLKLYYDTFSQAIAFLSTQKSRLDEARKRGEKRVFAETRAGWKRWFDIPHAPAYPVGARDETGLRRITVEAMNKHEQDMEEYRSRLAGIKRQLANTPIQGLSAAITKLAAAFWYERVGYDPEMRLVAIVHDENLVEVVLERVEEAKRILEDCMIRAMKKYLHVVDLGEIHAVITPFWKH